MGAISSLPVERLSNPYTMTVSRKAEGTRTLGVVSRRAKHLANSLRLRGALLCERTSGVFLVAKDDGGAAPPAALDLNVFALGRSGRAHGRCRRVHDDLFPRSITSPGIAAKTTSRTSF